jgi:hypothetical protein
MSHKYNTDLLSVILVSKVAELRLRILNFPIAHIYVGLKNVKK